MPLARRAASVCLVLHTRAVSWLGSCILISTYGNSQRRRTYRLRLQSLHFDNQTLSRSYYTMATTSSLLSGKYTAKAHAAKVAHHLNSLNPAYSSATIYLESQKTRLLEDNDEPEPFR